MDHAAMLYEEKSNSIVHCFLCAHNCAIKPGEYGFCGVRQNIAGDCITYTYGEVISRNIDPVEKKPLYHFYPGTRAASIATSGCNFRCSFCQNWRISQWNNHAGEAGGIELAPEAVVRYAKRNGCTSIAYTYTEPTIFFEYAYDISRVATRNGLKNIFVTNGYMTPAALETIAPYLDACNVDLKSFSDDFYRKVCRARLQPVLDSIIHMKELGMWVEITTLIVPGQNDSDDELRAAAGFIAGVSTEIPWHINRFHPAYNAVDIPPTPDETLNRAETIGREAGLKYVYRGNISREAGTVCPACGAVLVERDLLQGVRVRIQDSRCPSCGCRVAGHWGRETGAPAHTVKNASPDGEMK
ncbi:MAG: AmmeMemoRadiSam system radical SAM enzyme [Chitinivibrionales bacterium]|nr:AmmeMemoRadiSam system radical SAM enzyme [Chitinivibrionales bacterium]